MHFQSEKWGVFTAVTFTETVHTTINTRIVGIVQVYFERAVTTVIGRQTFK